MASSCKPSPSADPRERVAHQLVNEGKLLAFVAPEPAGEALDALRAVPGCEAAADIGEVRAEPPAMVLVSTGFGGTRVMDQLVGDPLPRIC